MAEVPDDEVAVRAVEVAVVVAARLGAKVVELDEPRSELVPYAIVDLQRIASLEVEPVVGREFS